MGIGDWREGAVRQDTKGMKLLAEAEAGSVGGWLSGYWPHEHSWSLLGFGGFTPGVSRFFFLNLNLCLI